MPFSSNRKNKRPKQFDVSPVARKKVVSLKKKSISIELSRESARRFGAFIHSRFVLVIPAFAIALILIVIGYGWRAKADAIEYPTSCLGGWENSNNAAGAPEALGKADDDYTYQNSATIANSIAQIYCGDFKGDIPKDGAPTSLTIKLSLAMKTKQETIPATFSGDQSASTTNAIIDAPADSTSQLLIPITPTDAAGGEPSPSAEPQPKAPTETPVPVETPAPTPQPAPVETSPQARSGTNFIRSFFAVTPVYAQEAGTGTVITTLPPSSSTSTAPLPPADTQTADGGFAEVLYTFDGTSWKTLGTISWANLKTATFTIPIDEANNWDDLSKFQIEVKSLSSMDARDVLYLDGMELSVGYDNSLLPMLDPIPLGDGGAYKEKQLRAIIVKPRINDGSTNVIFYAGNSSTTLSYIAETVAHGELPLSQYFAPLPGPGYYVLIEYKNYGGTFGCNGISAAKCEASEQFVARTDFEVLDDKPLEIPIIPIQIPDSVLPGEPSPKPAIEPEPSPAAPPRAEPSTSPQPPPSPETAAP